MNNFTTIRLTALLLIIAMVINIKLIGLLFIIAMPIIFVILFFLSEKQTRLHFEKLARLWGLNYKYTFLNISCISGVHNGYKIILTYPNLRETKFQIEIDTLVKTSLFIGSAKSQNLSLIKTNQKKINSKNINLNKYYVFYSKDIIEAGKTIRILEDLLISRIKYFKFNYSTLYIKENYIEYILFGVLTENQLLTERLSFVEEVAKKLKRV